MNIKDAKQEIKNAITAYFSKNEFGEYRIPIERQRPIFLMGPPGIGKTAIMEQIAQELDKGIVSYSMTHHTRQSALGLPFIEKKTFGGQEYSVSEYTMSEIIASVYEMMEETGKKEGILFLDEINCVSETLAPSMLQFLQYKVFGRHRVPEGWIVVTAGNPPEFNNSVREFDIVTWDRLKRIDIDPEYEVWKEYAYKSGVHGSIITYLDLKKSDFYRIETTVDGKTFVTARGWSDLSEMIKLYEENQIPVTEKLVSQYLQDRKTSRSFALYYDLYNKYKSDYQVEAILAGQDTSGVREKAKEAKFDERLSLLGLLIDGVSEHLKNVWVAERVQTELLSCLKAVRMELAKPRSNALAALEKQIAAKNTQLTQGRRAGSLSHEDQFALNGTIRALEELQKMTEDAKAPSAGAAFKQMKESFDEKNLELKKLADAAGKKLSNAFRFCEDVFGEGQEMLIFVTELTMSFYGTHFISRYGSKEFFAHNKELLFHEQQKAIIEELELLELE